MNLKLVNDSDADPDTITFDDFWAVYPRKVAKLDARKAWAKISPSLHVTIIGAVIAWARIWERTTALEFVPYPASWLRGERWDDETPRGFGVCTHASHVPAAILQPEVSTRSDIPVNVMAVLKRIREGRK